jgi:hypothetical protein
MIYNTLVVNPGLEMGDCSGSSWTPSECLFREANYAVFVCDGVFVCAAERDTFSIVFQCACAPARRVGGSPRKCLSVFASRIPPQGIKSIAARESNSKSTQRTVTIPEFQKCTYSAKILKSSSFYFAHCSFSQKIDISSVWQKYCLFNTLYSIFVFSSKFAFFHRNVQLLHVQLFSNSSLYVII